MGHCDIMLCVVAMLLSTGASGRSASVLAGKDLSTNSVCQGWNADWNRSMVSAFLKESLVLSVYVKQARDQGLASIGLLVSDVAQHARQWRDLSAGLMA